MNRVTEVRLWGRSIGAVSLADGDDVVRFEYDPAFIGSGIEIAPLMMPLASRVYHFPELSRQTFTVCRVCVAVFPCRYSLAMR